MAQKQNMFLSSASIKEQGRTAYYKMLESARQGNLIQVRVVFQSLCPKSVGFRDAVEGGAG